MVIDTVIIYRQDSSPEHYPQIFDAPHQPRSFHFPRRSFANKNLVKPARIQRKLVAWFDSHTWLHYSESKDLAFCYMCIHIAINKNDIQYKYYN